MKNNLRKITQVSEQKYKSTLKENKSALKENMLQHGHNIAYLQIIQAGLPIYVLLLSGNNCLLYSSIGISFKSIPK
jgi:hypothetical protein